MPSKTRQGIAPCLGMIEGLELDDFFLIFGPATYFLNKLSNAALASIAFRGAGMTPFPGVCDTTPLGAASRATVTRGENSEHSFAWSFTAMRTGIGFRH